MAKNRLEDIVPVVRLYGLNTDTATTLKPATALTAGGVKFLGLGTSGFGVYGGSGVPTVSDPQGSLYLRSDGSSVATRLYINTNGATTWTNVATAA